ncbi:MAG: hypothetical protein Q9219_003952 [cf. Caloplaca sp. 3 TL-2023]
MLLLLLPLLSSLALHIPLITAAVVAFANFRSPSPSTFQVCKSGTHTDICCVPLDLDIHDGRGYGWFRADMVAFSRIETPQTSTYIFGRRSARICSDDLIAGKRGNSDWQQEVPEAAGGAGSAAVVQSANPADLKLRYPEVIVVGDVRYFFYYEDEDGFVLFVDQAENMIVGRPFKDPLALSRENGTRGDGPRVVRRPVVHGNSENAPDDDTDS